MKNKLLFLTFICLLTGCGEKDEQYYYDNPAELKKVITECETKAKAATTDEELDKLATDEMCRKATVAAVGIQTKNLKNAMLEEEKIGWAAYIQAYKKALARKKEKEAAAAAEKIEADKLREAASKQNWKDYLDNEENRPYFIADCLGKNTILCSTREELWQQKAKEGEEELFTLSYEELMSKEKEYCKEYLTSMLKDQVLNSCSVWQKVKDEMYQKEFDNYVKGDESKLRKDYQLCRENAKKHESYTSSWQEEIGKYPCNIVGNAAYTRYDRVLLNNFMEDLPE